MKTFQPPLIVCLILLVFLLPVWAVQSAVLEGLPEDFEVQGFTSYQGVEAIDLPLDNSGHQTTLRKVVINRPDRPIVLLLNAYDPVVWDIEWTGGTTIAGVVVVGYHGQAVIGIDKSVPLAISSYEGESDFRNDLFESDSGEPTPLMFNAFARDELGEAITLLQSEATMIGDQAVAMIGPPVNSLENLLRSDDLTLDDYRDETRPPAGEAGLQALLDEGSLRLATLEDLEDWITNASAPFLKFNPAARVNVPNEMTLWHHWLTDQFGGLEVNPFGLRGAVLVARKPFTLPDGLYGANSAAFILPEGMDLPDGPRGHNTFFRNDGTIIDGPGQRGPHTRPLPDDSTLAPFFVNLPDNARILAAATYNTDRKRSDVQLDTSGNTVSEAEVIVHETDQPVVLVLSAYDPMIWNVGVTEGTEILGIVVSGYHQAALVGISETIPFVIATHSMESTSRPFEPFYFYEADEELLRLNQRVEAISGGLEVNAVTFAETNGFFEVGEERTGEEAVLYPRDLTLAQFIDEDLPLSGQQGLDALVAEGKLRLATMADAGTLVDANAEAIREFAPGFDGRPHFHLPLTYTILETFTFPPVLYGAHSRTFLLPSDVSAPDGDPGHSRVYPITLRVEEVGEQSLSFGQWLELQGDRRPADSDGDGVNDTLEFVFGSDPEDGSDTGNLEITVEQIEGKPHMVLSLPIRSNSAGMEPVLQSSTDGRKWKPVLDEMEMVERKPISEWADHYRFRSVDPVSSGQPIQLYRLSIAK
ncbi:MAG: hypothetical protein AAF514_03085 [Verrucomicrobiota bacterium]